jgi:hypothetical protein
VMVAVRWEGGVDWVFFLYSEGEFTVPVGGVGMTALLRYPSRIIHYLPAFSIIIAGPFCSIQVPTGA